MSSIILLADLEPRTTAAGKTEVVGQIARCLAVQALVNQCRQLESDTLSHRQPMKRLENRRNVVGAPDSSHQRHPYSYRLVVGTQSVYMWLCIRPLEHIFFGIILTVLVM